MLCVDITRDKIKELVQCGSIVRLRNKFGLRLKELVLCHFEVKLCFFFAVPLKHFQVSCLQPEVVDKSAKLGLNLLQFGINMGPLFVDLLGEECKARDKKFHFEARAFVAVKPAFIQELVAEVNDVDFFFELGNLELIFVRNHQFEVPPWIRLLYNACAVTLFDGKGEVYDSELVWFKISYLLLILQLNLATVEGIREWDPAADQLFHFDFCRVRSLHCRQCH